MKGRQRYRDDIEEGGFNNQLKSHKIAVTEDGGLSGRRWQYNNDEGFSNSLCSRSLPFRWYCKRCQCTKQPADIGCGHGGVTGGEPGNHGCREETMVTRTSKIIPACLTVLQLNPPAPQTLPNTFKRPSGIFSESNCLAEQSESETARARAMVMVGMDKFPTETRRRSNISTKWRSLPFDNDESIPKGFPTLKEPDVWCFLAQLVSPQEPLLPGSRLSVPG
ncbi:hypothetical protein F5146DRAFT_1125852 [Armillaria mellea]|nr:hypothetical protein F5146DRAFT_1125852 [Armillaria mellea]